MLGGLGEAGRTSLTGGRAQGEEVSGCGAGRDARARRQTRPRAGPVGGVVEAAPSAASAAPHRRSTPLRTGSGGARPRTRAPGLEPQGGGGAPLARHPAEQRREAQPLGHISPGRK